MYFSGRLIAGIVVAAFIGLMYMPAKYFFPLIGIAGVGLGYVMLDGRPTGAKIVMGVGALMFAVGIWINIRGDADDQTA